MSVLRSLESRIAGLVEGTFSRTFRSEVRPIEIARRLAREMDLNRVPFVSRVYVPSTYTVFLGPDDYERFRPATAELVSELSTFLLEHARRERLVLAERPRIAIELDERLGLGEFGIRTTPVDREGIGSGEQPREQQAPAARPAPRPPAIPVATTHHAAPRAAALISAGRRIDLPSVGAVLGRSSSCEIVLEDPNASRRHAAVRQVAGAWVVEDLGSTNGVRVNGTRVSRSQQLRAGDRIELGRTELTFDLG